MEINESDKNKDMWFGARAKAQNDNSYQYFSGLMSHIHFCDGYAYDVAVADAVADM